MKLSVHHLRSRNGITAETMKRLISLEDSISDGSFSKQNVFEATDIYSRFVEYLEYIKDPLKLYFQEKIENLFLKKTVMKVIIEEDNAHTRSSSKDIEILSHDFLQFSEINDLKNSVINNTTLRAIDLDNRMDKAGSKGSKNKKNLDLMMMFKVNDELKQKQHINQIDMMKKFSDFEKNNIMIKGTLNAQEDEVFQKVRQRRSKNFTKDFSLRSKVLTGSSPRTSIFNTSRNINQNDSNTEKIIPEDLLKKYPGKSDDDFEDNILVLKETLDEAIHPTSSKNRQV